MLHRYETVRQQPAANGHSLSAGAGVIPVFDMMNDNLSHPVAHPHPTDTPRTHSPDHHGEFTQPHEDVPEPDFAPVAPSPKKIRVGSVNANPPVTYDHSAEYAAKLAEANAEISRLKIVLARNSDNQSMRCRTVFSHDGTSRERRRWINGRCQCRRTGHQAGWRAIEWVAMLSLLVFVVTYLFF
jgi:hypothetical protein